MTITLDKDYIRASKIKEVKELAKEFKARYTDNDLRCAFADKFDEYGIMGADILRCDVEAYEQSWHSDESELSCRVEMVLEGISRMYKLSFYTDMDLKINDTDNVLHEIREYVLAEKR